MKRLALALVAIAAGACHLCEYRDYADSISVDVSLDEPGCPPPPEGKQDPPDNHGLVSVNGPGQRRVARVASVSCCYDGRFLYQGAEFVSEICCKLTLPGRGDEPDVACPDAATALEQGVEMTFTHDDLTRGVDRDDVRSLDGEPRQQSVSPRRDICVYPATYRTTADACG